MQNIKDYLKPKVVLTDLNQLIDVEGIGLISAHQICDKILNEVKGETKEDKVKISGLVTPTLPHSVKQVIVNNSCTDTAVFEFYYNIVILKPFSKRLLTFYSDIAQRSAVLWLGLHFPSTAQCKTDHVLAW